MALYWHPFLAEMLRLSYTDRLLIREQLPLGDLPLQADLLLIRRDPAASLPYPLEFLGRQTLVEFKSPDDTADQAALEQLEIYGLLYVRREKLARRSDLTLWLMASQVAANVSQPGRCELVGLHPVGPGVSQGTLDGFPTYLVDLQALPFSADTIPLHMVARGRQERALAEYIVSHYREYPRQLDLLTHLHLFALVEVLMTHNLTPEQIGLDPDAVALFVARFYPNKALERIETEDLAKELIRRLGKEKVRELLDERSVPPEGGGQ
jgi:hypothetical protein